MKKENPEILDEYLNYLISAKSYTVETVKSYNIDLLLFFDFIKKYLNIKQNIKDFNKFVLLQVKEKDVIAFMVYCNYARDNNPYTRERKLVAIRGFYNWLLDTFKNDYITNPTANIGSIKKVIRLPKYLNLEQAKEIQQIFTNNNCKDPHKNNAIITLFLSTGIRVSELINIKIKDIDFVGKTIKIFGKGSKERIVYFSEKCKIILQEYIKTRENSKNEYLFLNNKNEKYTRNGIYHICKKAYKLLDLEEKHFSTHTLRHTSATILYMYVKQDTLLLKQFLGHSSIASTQIYTHIHNDKIKDAVEKNPLSNFDARKGER